MFCLSVISLIDYVTFLHHTLKKIKHCLEIGQQNIDSCVNIVILTLSEFLVDCNPLHNFLSKLSDSIKINWF